MCSLCRAKVQLIRGCCFTGSLPGQVLWNNYQLPDLQRWSVLSPWALIRSSSATPAPRETTSFVLSIRTVPQAAIWPAPKLGQVCAMIYVFDNDQEMGECCGCPSFYPA